MSTPVLPQRGRLDPFLSRAPFSEAPEPAGTGVPRGLTGRYRRLFSVAEIEQSPILKAMLGVLLALWLMELDTFAANAAIQRVTSARGLHLCWPYFLGCGKLYFLTDGSQPWFYFGLKIVVLIAGLLM